jgi:[ribosomal protein S5]-alanine N-acetyltransferase
MSEPSTFATVTLETPRLILREFIEGDAEAIQVYAGDPEVTRFTSWGPNTPEVTNSVLANWIEGRKSSPRTEWPLAIVRQEDGALIGGAGLSAVDWSTGAAIFGYVLRQSVWGQGYATEACGTIRDWALNQLGLRRLVAHCEPANTASSSVLGKLGFWQEAPISQPRVHGEIRFYLTFVRERR